jgi:hypothetical protein
MKRTVVTVLALMALTATAFGAVQVTHPDARTVCVPPAVIQALS